MELILRYTQLKWTVFLFNTALNFEKINMNFEVASVTCECYFSFSHSVEYYGV